MILGILRMKRKQRTWSLHGHNCINMIDGEAHAPLFEEKKEKEEEEEKKRKKEKKLNVAMSVDRTRIIF